MRYFRLPPRLVEIFALLGCYYVGWFVTDVSGQRIDPIFNGPRNYNSYRRYTECQY
jgi:hypothetical protein